jgi:putative heme-binding domain-containing protein
VLNVQLNLLYLLNTIALAVTLGGQTAKVSQTNPAAGNPQAIESGRIMFRMACAGCHGLHATGGRSGPDLTRGSFSAGETDADLFRVISDGVSGTEMPGFGSRMEEDERWRLVAYVRSLAPHETKPVPGNPTAGSQLFWGKGNCGQCHRVGIRGSTIGPNLTRAGRQRSLDYLRESVVSPNAQITPGYATVTVVTRDGKKITGLDKGFDNFSARLMDLSGRYYSFQRDDAASIDREFRSLMPLNYARLFSERELEDLVSYLASLRGEER